MGAAVTTDTQRVPDASDWILDPIRHADHLPEQAKPLAMRLCDPSLQPLLKQFENFDRIALRAQARYRFLASTAAYSSFGAVLFGTITLISFAFKIPPSLLFSAMIMQSALVIAGLSAAILNGWLHPFEDWQTARAQAESTRLAIFEKITLETDGIEDADIAALRPLQLAYFRRYQLDVQRDYYRKRASYHGAVAQRHRRWRMVALALMIAASASLLWSLRSQPWLPAQMTRLLALLPDQVEAGQRLFLALGIWAAALQSLLASLSLISLDERNAARYRLTSENLDALSEGPLHDTRESLAADAATADRALREFVQLVHDQISTEHREWVALRKAAPELSLRQLTSHRQPS